jgi:anti-sigma B factor antagonist
MQISTRDSYGITVVDMEGSLDTSTSGETGDELVRLVKAGNDKILLNLEKLDYVSSAGLRAILVAAKLLQNARGEMRICSPNDTVREVLEISGFHSLLRLHDTEADALRMRSRRFLTRAVDAHTPQPHRAARTVRSQSVMRASAVADPSEKTGHI